MHSIRNFCAILLCAAALAPVALKAATPGPPATVLMIAGNGQVVQANFAATVPLTILVNDANGIPVAGVPVSWSLSCTSVDYGCNAQLAGTLLQPTNATDSNGIASTGYNQTYVPPGLSFTQATVTAATSVGNVTFKVTAAQSLTTGSPALSALLAKPGANTTISGAAGTLLAGAVQVFVSAFTGFSEGQPIPNVGIRIIDAATRTTTQAAYCNAPAGIVLTDPTGNATCDLVLSNAPGSYRLAVDVGGGQAAPEFVLNVTSGSNCTYSLAPLSQAFPSAGGSGFFNVTATGGCPWTASTSSSGFIAITSGISGTGNGIVAYTVGTNPGAARSQVISVAGQTFTVNQAAAGSGPGPLTITSAATLPGAVQNIAYTATLTASGGTGTYTWAVTSGSLPPGLTLTVSQNNGVISGTPTNIGTSPFTITVTDTGGAAQSQAFTITVGVASGTLMILTSTAANGAVGVPYTQSLTFSQPASGACGSPFTTPAFSVTSGALPPGLSLQNSSIVGTPTAAGTYSFTLVVGNIYCQSPPVTLSIFVGGASTSTILNANPTSLAFSVAPNGTAPAAQLVGISSTGLPVALAASANVTWLSLTLNPAVTPAVLSVGIVNYSSLTPAVYQGIITIATTDNSNFLTIPVTLTVTGGPPPAGITVSTHSLSFTLPPNSYSQQVVSVLGSGSNGNVAFIATASTSTGATWLGLATFAGTAPVSTLSSTTPANLGVSVNTAGLAAGKYTGTITLQQQGSSPTLTIQVNMVVGQNTLTVDMQSVTFMFVPGVTPPSPQTINVFANSPVQVVVTATTAAGGNWLFTTLAGTTVPTAVTVSVNPAGLARGTYSGTVTITPADTTVPSITVPVSLTIGTGPGPTVNGVVNSASNQPGPISPGEFVTVYGSAMSSSTPALLTLTSDGTISTSLNGTQVLFDGLAAPLVYVSATQINAIVPYEVFGRASTQLQVSYNGNPSSPVNLAVGQSAPGIFLCLACQPSSQAAALNQDGTPNSTTNGALPGSTVTLYATGEGQTNPPGTTGSIVGATLAQPVLPVSVRIDGLSANVTYAGSAPSLAEGILQVNVQIPAGVPRGSSVSVTLTVGNQTSNQGTIAIAP